MIDLTPQIQYPLFFKCSTKVQFEELNKQANELLGFSNAGAENYCNPIIDKDGKHWFTVNPEVANLVDIEACKSYEEIVLPEIKL